MFEWLDGLSADLNLRAIYLGCAVAGGAIMSLQMILLLFGGDVDADTDVDDFDASGDGFGFISVRSIAGFLTFFGLMGLYGHSQEWPAGRTIGSSLGVGAAMMVLVAWVMSLQSKLYSQGNLDPSKAVGMTARVYLRIPGESAGMGKITVVLQGRSQEYAASTEGPEIPTGASVRILRMTTPGSFEVETV